MPRYDPPLTDAPAREALRAAVHRFAGLPFGWGKTGRGLPLRPDVRDFALELCDALPPLTLIRLVSCWMTRQGTVGFRCWMPGQDGVGQREAVVSVPCRGVACYAYDIRVGRGEEPARVEGIAAGEAPAVNAEINRAVESSLTHHKRSKRPQTPWRWADHPGNPCRRRI